MPFPRHTYLAVAGANILINISSSSELVGKSRVREEALRQQSSRCIAGFIYTSAGPGESSTDTIFGGHTVFAEKTGRSWTARRISPLRAGCPSWSLTWTA